MRVPNRLLVIRKYQLMICWIPAILKWIRVLKNGINKPYYDCLLGCHSNLMLH